ncbi:MAG: penicillin acylase family protein [Myxococcota bacterium]
MKWLLRGFGLLAALTVVLLLGFAWWVGASQPDVDGERTVDGLDGPVRVLRDPHGVPHIFAESQGDAYFALGFAHAQDRLWQMELGRRNVAGRISELFGDIAERHDLRMRALGYADRVEAAFEASPESVRALLARYAAGVNAYLEDPSFELPPEFRIAWAEPAPWTALDSVFVLYSFWPTLSGNSRDELRTWNVGRLADAEVAEALERPFPAETEATPGRGRTALDIDDLVATMGSRVRSSKTATAAGSQARPPDGQSHSNNWVISSTRSASGFPLLGNDPHLGLNTPSVWYLAHLSYAGQDVVGTTVPGAPAVVIGRNREVAWGFTTSQVDTDDLFFEALDPQDPTRYRTPDGWAKLETRDVTITVRGQGVVRHTLHATRHGPILPRALWAAPDTDPNLALAQRSTAHLVTDRTFEFFFGLNAARSWSDVIEASRYFSLPPHNLVFATRSGDIGYTMVGPVPVRGPRHQTRGLRPARGWDEDNDWLGVLPFEDRLKIKNPSAGYVITANGRIPPPGYFREITAQWPDPGRAARIEAQLLETPRHGLDSMTELQLDYGSVKVQETLPFLLRTKPLSERDGRALALLEKWDGGYGPEAPQPAIYAAFMTALTDRIYQDELGPAFEVGRGRRPEIVRDAFEGSLAEWCDNRKTPEPESCDDLLAPSLAEALDGLAEHYGEDYETWRWGEQLVVEHRHLGFGRIPGLRDLFNTRTPRGGGPGSPNVAYHLVRHLPQIVARSHGASLRFLTDLGDIERSRWVISTGQSGHFRSPHYADLQTLWTEGGYIEIRVEPARIETMHTLILRPR